MISKKNPTFQLFYILNLHHISVDSALVIEKPYRTPPYLFGAKELTTSTKGKPSALYEGYSYNFRQENFEGVKF